MWLFNWNDYFNIYLHQYNKNQDDWTERTEYWFIIVIMLGLGCVYLKQDIPILLSIIISSIDVYYQDVVIN